jgi:DNA/RNA endonuclease YhcR with UshA esterase domain
MKKKIWLVISVIVLLGGGTAYYLYNKPVASTARQKAEVQISAAELVAGYEADEETADQSYLGKIVEVTGKVSEVQNTDDKTRIVLETGSPMSTVICELEDTSVVSGITPGKNITVKGVCSGYLGDVILVRSNIVLP